MFKDKFFWVSILILCLTGVLVVASYFRWFDFGAVVGPYRLNHWLSWFGFLFIGVHVPLFVALKRRYVGRIRLLLGIHVVGNLLAFMLISIHFASQIGRPSQFYPDLGTGLALYIIMPTLVATGFLQRFNLIAKYRKTWRFLHTSLVVSLFILLLVHILQGIQLL
jgi:hypothetical protein